MATLDGIWKPVEAILNGSPLPSDLYESFILTVNGSEYEISEFREKDKGTLTIYPHAVPQAADFIATQGPKAGKKTPAIFKLLAGTLTISYNINGTERPHAFISTAENNLYTVKYRKM